MTQASIRTAIAFAALLSSSTAFAADEKAEFKAGAQVPVFADANCAIPTGAKVGAAVLNGQPFEDKKGCWAVKTKNKTYFVRRPVAQRECREVAANTINTETAGSAGANEKCIAVIK